METISIDHSRKDYGIMSLLGAVMLGASLYLLLGAVFPKMPFNVIGPNLRGLGFLAGGFGTVFFGYAFHFILRRFLFPKGALVISPDGIINRTNALGSKQKIPFSEMKSAQLEIIHSKPHIGIQLVDNERYLERFSFLKRKAIQINHQYFGMSMLSMDVPVQTREELFMLIHTINERIEQANPHNS